MIQILEDVKFFKISMSNTVAKTKVLEDVNNGFEGNFQTIAKEWKTEDFLALYDSAIEKFQEEIGSKGTVTKHLSWVNNIIPGESIPTHYHTIEAEGQGFSLRHYIKIDSDQPRTYYVINDKELQLENIVENDIVIHPATTLQGIKQNLSDSHMVILTFNFSIKD
jgi:hypothetical protein